MNFLSRENNFPFGSAERERVEGYFHFRSNDHSLLKIRSYQSSTNCRINQTRKKFRLGILRINFVK